MKRKSLILLFFLFIFSSKTSTQPANDNCENAIVISIVEGFCSEREKYTNQNATISEIAQFNCLPENARDVWFKFTAIAPNIVITIIGNNSQNLSGGTLRTPEAELFFVKSCPNDLESIECAVDLEGNNLVSLNKGGLVPGIEYLIRVQGSSGGTGTFQLCINNFTPAFPPESDCDKSHLLCDKSTIFVEKVNGAGNNPNEGEGTCLDVDPFSNSESSSVWYKWIAASNGSLTFILTPENPADDLDFALFELPNGIDDCRNKMLLRCIASGENRGQPFSEWQRCVGPTGLSLNDMDMEEIAGCQSGDNNFVSFIEMEEGTAYALLINNFSETETGFTLQFGGTGEFQGPEPQIDAIINSTTNVICAGEEVTFRGDNSRFILGEITEYEWTFGVGAVPSTTTGSGPHVVRYEEPGDKSVVLTITTDLGCKVSDIEASVVIVEACCEEVNNITGSGIISDVICGNQRGAIDFSVSSNSPISTIEWSNNATTEDVSDLAPDIYMVTVTNLATCRDSFTFPVDSVAPFEVLANITKPTCDGGRDGAIELNITDGFEPIQIDFGNGFGNGRTLTDLTVGDYPITIVDGNGCTEESIIEVRELELELDSSVAAISPPSCFGFNNGKIELNFVNGLPPYQFDWNDGNGMSSNNTLDDLTAGTYTVNVLDQNLCKGDFEFMVEDPLALELLLDTVDVSCAGEGDGSVEAIVEGGTGDYAYIWSNNQTNAAISNLGPGTYSLTVLDENQCEIQGEALITQPPIIGVNVIDEQDVICFGDETGIIVVEGFGGNPNYEFSIDGLDFQNNAVLTNLAAGDYTITIRDQLGCTADVSAFINQPDELSVDAGEDLTVNLGFSGELNATTSPFFRPVVYSWTPAAFLSCADCPNPTASPPIHTTFIVTITDETNCMATDSLQFFINPIRPIYVPNAFTPNFDGKNDFFTLYGGPAADRISELRIFDRWGNLVYEAANIPLNEERLGWDGRFNGRSLPQGVYAFMAKVTFIDEATELFEGDITLIR